MKATALEKPCRSPKRYSGLKPGKHKFRVKATDAAGNTDQSARRRWKIVDQLWF